MKLFKFNIFFKFKSEKHKIIQNMNKNYFRPFLTCFPMLSLSSEQSGLSIAELWKSVWLRMENNPIGHRYMTVKWLSKHASGSVLPQLLMMFWSSAEVGLHDTPVLR